MVALGIAGLLGAWLIVTALGGAGATKQHVGPAAATGSGEYRLNGIVAPGAPQDAAKRALTADGVTFTVRDKKKRDDTITVVYRGKVPDTFKSGREITIDGRYENGAFQGDRDTLVTLCPSKFSTRTGPNPHENGDLPPVDAVPAPPPN